MFSLNSLNLLGKAIKQSLLAWALPRIVELPLDEWDEALKQARETNFDTIELIGVLAGIAFTTYLLSYDAAEFSLPIHFIAQYLAAFPLLTLLAGPFYLRCLRRGLDHVIERRHLPLDSRRRRHVNRN